MGKITINELHKSLFDYVQTVSDDKLETNNKTIIGAINELFSDNSNIEINNLRNEISNGKKLIADAIGEPLDSNDTFSAMSSDINSLLSTFKTNMMNNGVVVESGDKFKVLIDKIATLVDSEGKGIRYAEINLGAITLPKYDGFTLGKLAITINYNERDIDFIPSIVFVHYGTIGIMGSNFNKTFTTAYNLSATIDEINNEGFVLNAQNTYEYERNIGDVIIYLIGVGEEDTTLRDSLASILQDEGVNVTEEDDMASLITKTDKEFQDNTTILYNKMKDANYDVNSYMNMDTLLNKLNLKSKIKGTLTNQGVADETSITFTARNLEFTPSLVYVSASGITEQIDDEGNMHYYDTLTITNENIFIGASSDNTIKVNILNNGFEVKFITDSFGYNKYLNWITINGIGYTAIR